MGKAQKKPGYLHLFKRGELGRRRDRAREMLRGCDLCPHGCGVDRLAGEVGICRNGALARVASYGPHFGEETPLVGRHGSGTIFFAGCNLLCVFCQNYGISHIDRQGDKAADAVDERDLAAVMLELQERGCGNINLVTPSHVVPQILGALEHAAGRGLRLPLVYNSGGFDSVNTLKLLAGVVDIYMPDCKFWSGESSRRYTATGRYPEVMRRALREMHAQVGDLVLDERGAACRGLLVRHLVMPGHLDETRRILRFIAREISPDTYVNIMDQYRPEGRAHEFPEIGRHLEAEEYRRALDYADQAGLHRLDRRDLSALLRLLDLDGASGGGSVSRT